MAQLNERGCKSGHFCRFAAEPIVFTQDLRMSDMERERSGRPDWVSAHLNDLNIQFREIVPRRRGQFRDTVEQSR